MNNNPFSEQITVNKILEVPENKENLDTLIGCAELVAEQIQEKTDISKLKYWEDLDKVVKNQVIQILNYPETATDEQTWKTIVDFFETMVYFLVRHLMKTHPNDG